MTAIIYDWRPGLIRMGQHFAAGGQALNGGLTGGGINIANPEPGGVGMLAVSFPRFFGDRAVERQAGWTVSRIRNGSVMRIPLCASYQTLSPADLGVTPPATGGIPWDNSNPWDGNYWAYALPTAPVVAAASEGQASITIDMSAFGQVLQPGHVFGFRSGAFDFTHEAMAVTYDSADVATVEISPPLRRDVTTSTEIKFRPSFMGVCVNASEAFSSAGDRRHAPLPELQFREYLP
jgi:hypothetical protein